MSADQLFSLLNLIAVSGWLLLAVSPRWPWLVGVAGRAFPALFALVYVAVIALNWRGSDGGFSSLADVAALFTNPWLLWQYLHNMIGSVITAAFVVASIGAYYLLNHVHEPHARTFVGTGVVAGFIASMALKTVWLVIAAGRSESAAKGAKSLAASVSISASTTGST